MLSLLASSPEGDPARRPLPGVAALGRACADAAPSDATPGAAAGTAGGRFLRLAWALLALTTAVLLTDHWAQRHGWWDGSIGLVFRFTALLGLLAPMAARCARSMHALEADLHASRALVEQPLHDTERFIVRLMANLPGMVYRCRNDEQWTMEFVSAGCKTVTGYEPGQHEHNREVAYGNLIHPDDREAIWSKSQASLETHQTCDNEYRIVARDGSVRWVWERAQGLYAPDGTLLGIEGFVQDITERKQGESRLLQSERKLHAIVESALDAAVRIDARGHVLGWNAQAEKTFGWSAQEAVARPLHELIIPQQHRQAHVRGMRHYLATGEGPVLQRRVELTALHRDGREFPVELAISPIVTADGVEFSAFVRDISDRRQAEQARRALEAQLRESQKMEAIGTLAGGIAHDFNNILAGILGNVELACAELGPGSAAQTSLEQIRKAGLRARSLVQQILAFGRRQEQQLGPLPLHPVVEESHALLRAVLPASAVLDEQLTDEPLWVMADATQLQQVLMNLCTNAWHALDGKAGRIEVGLQAIEFAEAALRPAGLAAGRYARLWVRDSGRGMDAITRSRVFEPFFTTKPVGQGTGLGLSVVHGIVAAHGGGITVDSTLGRGSCFHVYLPLCEPESAAAPLDEAAVEALRGHGQHVLYVDDDEVMVLLVGKLLERAGYRVTSCQHAQQALALVREQPQAFDAVVSDYNMPDLSGGDLARALAAIRPGLPVVISSGHITAAMRAEAAQAGVRALLRKENTFEELAGLVQGVL